ncbi:MAG: LysE family translocator [Alphaproteobacteria bacterium]|jgi:RhtB (resistance to homoserine/threonine) family protein|nr:LysE family transporter [Alphaproteobacteria bacterium]
MDATQINSLVAVASIVMVSVISPGPDFAMVMKNSLLYSRRTAFFTAFGISVGILVHLAYILLGLGLVIHETKWLFHLLQYAGAAYLFYLGTKGILAKKGTLHTHVQQKHHEINSFKAFTQGFLTNALNPKCMLFLLSLFTTLIPAKTPTLTLSLYGAIIFLETLLWFGFVAFCLSGARTRAKFTGVRHWIDRVTGAILLGLSVKILFF